MRFSDRFTSRYANIQYSCPSIHLNMVSRKHATSTSQSFNATTSLAFLYYANKYNTRQKNEFSKLIFKLIDNESTEPPHWINSIVKPKSIQHFSPNFKAMTTDFIWLQLIKWNQLNANKKIRIYSCTWFQSNATQWIGDVQMWNN